VSVLSGYQALFSQPGPPLAVKPFSMHKLSRGGRRVMRYWTDSRFLCALPQSSSRLSILCLTLEHAIYMWQNVKLNVAPRLCLLDSLQIMALGMVWPSLLLRVISKESGKGWRKWILIRDTWLFVRCCALVTVAVSKGANTLECTSNKLVFEMAVTLGTYENWRYDRALLTWFS